MKAAAKQGDVPAAKAIYTDGKNSFSTSRALRRYQSWALAAHPTEPTYSAMFKYHATSANDTSVFDRIVLAAFDSGRPAAGWPMVNIMVNHKYFLHELDAAYVKLTTMNYSAATEPLTAAPHNIDEAWTIFAGGHPQPCGETPLERIAKMSADFGITYAGQSPINWGIVNAVNNLMGLSMPGSGNFATSFTDAHKEAYNANLATVNQLLATYNAQGVLRGAYQTELYRRCQRTGSGRDARDVMAAYWASLAPYLRASGASASAVSAVQKAATAGSVSYAAVEAALMKAAAAARLPAGLMGKPSFGRLSTGCPSSAAPRLSA